MGTMYGAKAIQISKVAKDTWGVKATEKQEAVLQKAIHEIADNNSVSLDDLNLPAALKHEEFRRLVISLADNPLAA